MNQPTFEQLVAAFEATKLPPKDDFERLVAIGLINSEGQLTKLYGGEAEPESWAKRPRAVTSANVNGERNHPQPKRKRRRRS